MKFRSLACFVRRWPPIDPRSDTIIGAVHEVFEHTADLGLRVRARTLQELLVEAARGFLSIIVDDPEDVQPTERVTIDVTGTDPAYLLFDWLNELLYLFDTRKLLLCEFDVRINAAGVHADARGETLDTARHRAAHEVKAITYHGLSVKQVGETWEASAIVDI